MKYLILLCITVILMENLPLQAQMAPLPVNPHATPATGRVLSALYNIKSQGKILSCQHVRERTADILGDRSEYKHVYDVTGKYPAILGVDFFLDPVAAVSASIQQWKRGGLVTITWHQSSPALEYQGPWKTVQAGMSDIDFQHLVTAGTSLHATWLDHIDRMANHLKVLRDSGVVVLWRPYHEMNGNWFWWCGKGEEFRKLWINMYERYTKFHHLDNLIWVFGPNIKNGDPALYYPGEGYVDIGGLDIYNSTRMIDIPEHNRIQTLLNGKPIAMTESGILPPVSELLNKTAYLWFMPWHTGWCDNTYYGTPSSNGPGNNAEILKEYYLNPSVVNLDNLAEYTGHRGFQSK